MADPQHLTISPQCHIPISARMLPCLPWVALVARHEVIVLRNAQLLNSEFYPEVGPEKANLEAYVFGPGYILLDGKLVTEWEGHLSRLLLFFILDRPLVTRTEICEAFWPDSSLDHAVNVFHVTKRRLHKAIGFDVISHEGGLYKVDSSLSLHYDAMDFSDALIEARSSEDEAAAAAWRRTIDSYRGTYLRGHNQDWIVSRRNDLIASYVEALSELARLRAVVGANEEALGLFLRAVSELPNREDIHREVMRLYSSLGRHSEAVEHFQVLRADLKATLGISPSPETRAIYEELSG